MIIPRKKQIWKYYLSPKEENEREKKKKKKNKYNGHQNNREEEKERKKRQKKKSIDVVSHSVSTAVITICLDA